MTLRINNFMAHAGYHTASSSYLYKGTYNLFFRSEPMVGMETPVDIKADLEQANVLSQEHPFVRECE